MRRFLATPTLLAIIFLITAGYGAPAMARTAAGSGHWCSIRVKGLYVDSDIFFATVLPRKTLTIEIIPNSPVTDVRWHVSGGRVSSSGGLSRNFVAPSRPGYYPIEVKARMRVRAVTARIQVFVMTPATQVRNGMLEGYRIGVYPDPNNKHGKIYQPPPGFIRVTRETVDLPISEHYRLGTFLCPGGNRFPKFLVLNEALILKLEKVTHEFHRLRLLRGRISFLSTYRSPAYNVKPGQARYSRHMWGSALDMFIDEHGKPGWMDDLNRDGKVDIKDAILMFKVIDAMSRRGALKGMEGGLGIYPGTQNHGPFIHMDVREGERPFYWAKDERGNRIKDVHAWLTLPENKVRLPVGLPESDYVETRPAVVSPPEQADDIEEMKNNISALESQVVKLEEHARSIEAGRGPIKPEDLYIAADVANEALLMNRGRTILKRARVERGDPPAQCPRDLAAIYCIPHGILEVRRNNLEPVWFHPPWALLGSDLPGVYSQFRKAFFSGINVQAGIDLGAAARIHGLDKNLNLVLPGCLGMATEDLRIVSGQAVVGTRVYLFRADSTRNAESKLRKDLITLTSFLQFRQKAAAVSRKYLVIDLEKNRGWIKQDEKVLRSFAIRRVGPNFSRAFPNAARQFRLPRGVFLVRYKLPNPSWYKPDWLFEEQKKTVPAPLGAKRIQTNLLGKYAVYIGGGMVIHGIHDPKVPERSIDYVALELKNEDLSQVWQSISDAGVVIVK